MKCIMSWPEPVVRVQSLADSGIKSIPQRYIKPPSHRPSILNNNNNNNEHSSREIQDDEKIPIVDLQDLFFSEDENLRRESLNQMSKACREWGFFQVLNHGVNHELMEEVKNMWREFFNLPLDVKQEYANSPSTYEGYGSRVGVQKGAILDWSDYFFLHYMPSSLKNPEKWPKLPHQCRTLIEEYGREVGKLSGRLMKALSTTLGLKEDTLLNAFGGDNIGACLRVNFYPKCPQPDLTLGLSPHSDPGGLTILLPDNNVSGLQVRKGNSWVTVKPVPNAFIVNLGDQIQVLSNAFYKSVEHRVIVNSAQSRVSLAFFYNPKSDLLIEPLRELVTKERPALYAPMTFDEYRLYIRMKGPSGKSQVDQNLKSSP